MELKIVVGSTSKFFQIKRKNSKMEACFCTLTNITEEDIYDSGMYEDKGEL